MKKSPPMFFPMINPLPPSRGNEILDTPTNFIYAREDVGLKCMSALFSVAYERAEESGPQPYPPYSLLNEQMG